jgi:hypothetical protein
MNYLDVFEALNEKYKDSPYMLNRIHHHLTNVLPNVLETEHNNYGKRLERNSQLLLDQETFIHLFLCKNAVFHLYLNNEYFLYNGLHYTHLTEDNLNHLILSSITHEGGEMLNQWKYKTKATIMRQIKHRPLWKSIPESVTIQNILSCLYPSCFETKEEAKYFCTIIGDTLLKKYSEEEGLYFLLISDKLKPKKMLMELDHRVSRLTNLHSITTNLVTKYHPTYNYDQCRILRIHDDIFHTPYLTEHIIDFLCVCTYHSERYQNSENFLLACGNDEFTQKATQMKGKTNKDVFETFCDECLTETPDGTLCSIEWKTVHYIWKLFIQRKMIPNIIYSYTLKDLLIEKYTFCIVDDKFIGLTSKWFPNTEKFLEFWNSSVTTDDTSSELEIEEIVGLFKLYTNNTISLSEEEILKIMNHYFSLDIVDKKYILNVSCKLWNKNSEIMNTLTNFKEVLRVKRKTKSSVITFDNIYSFYIRQKSQNKLHISKRYFEKYMDEYLEDFIVAEKCIHVNWLNE